jgi:hypothetical protein
LYLFVTELHIYCDIAKNIKRYYTYTRNFASPRFLHFSLADVNIRFAGDKEIHQVWDGVKVNMTTWKRKTYMGLLQSINCRNQTFLFECTFTPENVCPIKTKNTFTGTAALQTFYFNFWFKKTYFYRIVPSIHLHSSQETIKFEDHFRYPSKLQMKRWSLTTFWWGQFNLSLVAPIRLKNRHTHSQIKGVSKWQKFNS